MQDTVKRARVLALLFGFHFVSIISLTIKGYQKDPFTLLHLYKDQPAWMQVTLDDYFFGIFFSVVYLSMLNGPSLFYLPCRSWAALTVITGQAPALLYIAYLLYTTEESIVSVFLPFSSSTTNSSRHSRHYHEQEQQQGNTDTYNTSYILDIGGWFIAPFVILMYHSLSVLWTESVSTAWASMFDLEHPWRLATWMESRSGLLVTMAVALAREESFVTAQILWTVAFVMLGNMAPSIYFFVVFVQAHLNQIGFGRCLLMQRRLLWWSVLGDEDESQGLLTPMHTEYESNVSEEYIPVADDLQM